jgi:hypothetical protein
MEDKSGMGWAGLLLFFVVIWILFGSMAGNGLGWGNRNNWGGCDRVSNCEVEKQGIIDSAKTQYLIETTGRQTQEYLGNKIDFYEFQNLRDQLAAERSKNMVLENRLYSDAQFTALSRQLEGCCCANERRLDAIECQMLKRPAIYGIGATCSGQIIPPITTTTTTP